MSERGIRTGERGTRLLVALSDRELHDMSLTERMHIARAICEHLGITWDDAWDLSDSASGKVRIQALERAHAAYATLLEAAGIER